MRNHPKRAALCFALVASSAPLVAQSEARPRERPAMIPCPWPQSAKDTATPPAPPAPSPAGVIDPPRSRIPDCAPPVWKQPSSLKPFVAPPLPTDRPKAIVDDYLKYLVTAPPPAIVE